MTSIKNIWKGIDEFDKVVVGNIWIIKREIIMDNQDGAQILLNLCGVFGHYRFFTDKLWKK